MRHKAFSRLLLSTALLQLFLTVRWSGAKPEVQTNLSRPKLLLLIVIDQFRYDYLTRFRPYFVSRGFNLLLRGANFVDCRYNYATTATGPGFASLSTGAYPNLHGIIGNEWYDRSLHRIVYCVGDPTVQALGGREGPGISPKNLIGTTLADELRLATNFQSKAISISLKDRSAVLLGGHTANGAYWYDTATGQFVSSTYYAQELPAWVQQFNQQNAASAYCGQAWQALPGSPGEGRVFSSFEPPPKEPCPGPKFLAWVERTPFVTELELNFARQAILGEKLGQRGGTDLLALGLSANDYIGHAFGPYSPEVADATLRTDRDLADFFRDLDRTVGLDNIWVALSADHGVAPSPEFIKKNRLGPGRAEPVLIRTAVEKALSEAFGKGNWVEATDEFYLYLNQETLRARGVDIARAEEVAARAALSTPGVRMAFTRTRLLEGRGGSDPLEREAANSFNAQRGGDVFVILQPFAIPVKGEKETTHGSPWSYDAQVPLVFWGSGFRPGTYTLPCQPIDLAPTLAVALGLTQPSEVQGQPLTVALR